MKPIDQVVSQPLAKKMKELGIEQESLFVWWSYGDEWRVGDTSTQDLMDELHKDAYKKDPSLPEVERYYAYTVAELGEMLPYSFLHKDKFWNLVEQKRLSGYLIQYKQMPNVDPLHTVREAKEADARAKMLIYLVENNLLFNKKG